MIIIVECLHIWTLNTELTIQNMGDFGAIILEYSFANEFRVPLSEYTLKMCLSGGDGYTIVRM